MRLFFLTYGAGYIKEQRKTTSLQEQGESLLNEYSRQIKKRLPDLPEVLSSVEDPRKRHDYSMEEILMGGLSMFMLKQGSRNSINNKRREESFTSNYARHFRLRLPHQDTVADVLSELDPDKLDSIKAHLMSEQFEQKWLRGYRLLNKYYMVAVDGTGVVSFDKPHCEHCLTKTSRKGKTTYFHYVLEAKLVTPDGYCLSLASEWIENPNGEYRKQDCELKAFRRLSDKLKKYYPRLPICIVGDGLYANNTVFDICENNDWKYIIVLQDDQLKCIQEEVDLIREKKPVEEKYEFKGDWRITRQYRFHTGIKYKEHLLYWFSCNETKEKRIKSDTKNRQETSTFEYVSNLEPTKETVPEFCSNGRLRWKIENEGFNTQKNGGYELEHKFFRNSYQGLKNYFTLLQIAHFINQLVEKSAVVIMAMKMHSKETIRNIWINLIAYMIMFMPYNSLSNPPP